MRLILALSFLLFTRLGNSQIDKSSGLTSFVKEHYKIQYPKSWTLDTSGLAGSDLFILSPLENDTDKFRENVGVLIQNLAGQDINLDVYKDISEKQIASMGSQVELFESSIKERHYELKYAMNQGNFNLMVTSYCYLRGERAYLVTFTAESAKYEQYKKIGDRILDSFEVR